MTADGYPPLPTPNLARRIAAGASAGVAGGVVFGVPMQVTDGLPMVARLVDGESASAGWLVHMSIAAFIGVTYGVAFGRLAVALAVSTVLGVLYGLLWWVLGGLTLMPLRLGQGLFVFDAAAWQSLAGHLAYGVIAGVVYPVVARLLAGDPDPDGLPVVPQQPPGADAETGAGTARTPRGGVVPLSPRARAVRQRRHRP